MRNNVIKSDLLQKNITGLHQSGQSNAVRNTELVKRDITEQAIFNQSVKTMICVEDQASRTESFLSYSDDNIINPEFENKPFAEELSTSSENMASARPLYDIPPLEEIIERASHIGSVLGRSISKTEFEYIQQNWRSFYNAPHRFAATDTLSLIEDELKAENLLDQLCI